MAQAILAQLNPAVKVDGVWGTKTAAAYTAAAPDFKGLVKSGVSLVAPGLTPDDFMSAPVVMRPLSHPSAEVQRAINEAADEFDMSRAELTALVSIESGFNPKATNGSFKGLTQMGASAWASASAVVREMGGKPLGSYETEWSSPYASSRAGAAFARSNERAVRAEGYTGRWTADTMYLAHQQGARGLVEIHRASERSTSVSGARLTGMMGNPPQDGLGPTANPADFIRRWNAVTEARVSAYA
jgi:hypothetical protein